MHVVYIYMYTQASAKDTLSGGRGYGGLPEPDI